MSGRADTSTRDCLAKFKNIQIFAQCRDRKQNLQNLILCAFFAPSKENLNKKEENKHHSEGVKEKEGMITEGISLSDSRVIYRFRVHCQ